MDEKLLDAELGDIFEKTRKRLEVLLEKDQVEQNPDKDPSH